MFSQQISTNTLLKQYFLSFQQKPRERLSSNLIDLNSPPPEPNYVNDRTFDQNSNTTPPPITRDVFDMRKSP